MLARELDNPLKDWFNVFEISSAPIVASVAPGPNGADVDADADADDVDADDADDVDDDYDDDDDDDEHAADKKLLPRPAGAV